MWTFYQFNPGKCLRVFELVKATYFGWYYPIDERNSQCPCSPSMGLIAMKIEDAWLFLEFESPRFNVFNTNHYTNHHAMRICFLLVIYIVLQGLDSRTQYYLLAYDDTHACVGRIFYVSSGINRTNKSLCDSILCNPFPFDLSVGFKCVEYGSSTVFHSYDSYLVLLLDPMCLNEVCLPIWVGNTCVLEPAHELGIITFLKLASALDGVLIWVNITYAFALRYENIHVLLGLQGELCLLECGTNKGLYVWLFKCIGSVALTLCQSFWSSQVSLVLMGYKPFVDHFDAWLYVKLAHPWHGDIIVIANANPHALRILLLFAFLMVF